jgi:hypothetical protein
VACKILQEPELIRAVRSDHRRTDIRALESVSGHRSRGGGGGAAKFNL